MTGRTNLVIFYLYSLLLTILISPQPFALSPAPFDQLKNEDHYYSIRLYNRKIGYSKVEYTKTLYKGKEAVKITTEAYTRMEKGGTEIPVHLIVTGYFDSSLNLLFFSYKNITNPFEFTCEAKGDFLVFYDKKGRVTGKYDYDRTSGFADFYSLSIPDNLGPSEKITLMSCTIDPGHQSLISEKRVITFLQNDPLELSGRKFLTKKYKVEIENEYRKFSYNVWIDEEKKVVREEHDGVLYFSYAPEKEALSFSTLDIDGIDRIISDQKIILPIKADSMTVKITNPAGWPEHYFPGTPVQEVLSRTKTEVTLKLKRSVNTTGADLKKVPVPDGFSKYLEATDMIEADHPLIRQQAKKIVRNEKSIRKQVIKLLRWVAGAITYSNATGELTSSEILKQKKGDCSEYSNLLTAFLRSVGIPARQAGGLKYIGRGIFGLHSWTEIYTGSWITVDPAEGLFPGPWLIRIHNQGFFDTQGSVIEIMEYTVGTQTVRVKR